MHGCVEPKLGFWAIRGIGLGGVWELTAGADADDGSVSLSAGAVVRVVWRWVVSRC